MKEFFSEAGIEINETQEKKFQKLLEIFKIENGKINLSSFNDDKNIIIKHFVDSLLPCRHMTFSSAKNLVDLGTGSGFPGLALAIMLPQIQCILIDSVQKKIDAVERMAQFSGIKNVEVLCERIEAVGQNKKFRERFDIVTERALAKVSTMLEYCLPLAKINGMLIAYQTQESTHEFEEKKDVLEMLGGKIESEKEFFLPQNTGKRKIFFIKKIFHTKNIFPRKIGEPKNKPL